jgi:hypothetical protein
MTHLRTIARLGLAGCLACAACSSAGSDHPPQNATTSGASDGGSPANGDAEALADSATQGDGEAPPEDATTGDVMITPPSDASEITPSCSVTPKWSDPTAVPGFSTPFPSQPLVTMTNDELTVAWVLDAGGGKGQVFVADRTSTSMSFGAPTAVPSGTVGSQVSFDGSIVADAGDAYFAFDRVALSPDGLTLTGVAVGNHHMASFSRLSRTHTFAGATPFEPPYVGLTQSLRNGESLGDPVLGAHGDDLVYSVYGGGAATTVYESTRTASGENWPAGQAAGKSALDVANGQRKRPTSMTGDRLSLFYWDEAGGAYFVLRAIPTSQFSYPISLGDRFSVQVNGPCTRLYYVTPAAGGGYSLVQSDAR